MINFFSSGVWNGYSQVSCGNDNKKWEGHKCLRKWDIIQMQKKIQDGNSTRLIKHRSLGSTDTFKNN